MALLPMLSVYYLRTTYAIFKIQYNTMQKVQYKNQYTVSSHIDFTKQCQYQQHQARLKCCYFGGMEIKESPLSFRHASNYKLHLQTLKCDANESLFDCSECSVTNTSCGYEQRLCFIASSVEKKKNVVIVIL